MEPTLADRNYNPGNLKDPKTGTFRTFSSEGEGYSALMNDLQGKIDGTSTTGLNGESTIDEFSQKWAPASDKNDPAQYTANLANKLGIRPDTKLSELKDRVPDFAQAIAGNEGYTKAKSFKSIPKQATTIKNNVPQEDKTLAQTTIGRVNDIGSAVKTGMGGVSDITKGDVVGGLGHITSGLLQGVGAVAGELGDVTNKVIEKIPVVGDAVKGISNLIGSGVGEFAKTDVGQSVMKQIKDFTDKNPEISKDIGAGFNILTAIPIFKGLGLVKNIGMDALSLGLKNVAEKGAMKDLTEAVLRSPIRGRAALANSPDAIKTIINERALPEVENIGGKLKYTTKEAGAKLDDAISAKDDALDNILNKVTDEGLPIISKADADSQFVNLKQMRQNAISSAETSLEGQSNYNSVINKINNFFDTAESSKKALSVNGEKYLKMKDANFFKRQARQGLTWDDTVGRDAGYHVSKSYMKGIEDVATKNGLGDVHGINAEMGKLIDAQNMLKNIEGKTVNVGGEFTKDVAGMAGEKVGALTGTPYAGAMAGRGIGGLLSKMSPKSLQAGILTRTGKGAVRTTLNEAKRKSVGLIGGAIANKQLK